jgi:branched-chain amino acid transport system permease protein
MHLLIQAIIGGVILGCIYALAGVCFGIYYEISKVFHIAFGAIGVLGTLIAVEVANGSSGFGPVLLGIVLGMIASAIGSVFLYAVIYRPQVERGADAGTTFVSSLGASTLLLALISLAFGAGNHGFSVADFTQDHEVAGYGVSTFDWVVVISTILLIGALDLLKSRTRLGHQVSALVSNPEQAQLAGIRTFALGAGTIALVGAISMIAFAYQGMQSSVRLEASTQLTLFAVVAMIAGGVGSIRGIAVAGVAIGVLGGIAGDLVPGKWSTAIVFVCALAFIVARPSGVARQALAVAR